METIFMLLVLASFVLLIIGIFSPKTSLFWMKAERTRKKSSLIYLCSFIVFIMAFGAVAEPSTGANAGTESLASDEESEEEGTEKGTKNKPAQLNEQLDREIAALKKFEGSEYRSDVENIQMELVLFGVWAKLAKDGLLHEDKKINEKAKTLKSLLSKVQKREFPAMRKAYVKVVRQKLWEENIDVKGSGAKNDKMLLTAVMFANNKNIKISQETIQEIVSMLRFKQVQYKWSKYDDEYTYFDINQPADEVVTEKLVR